MEFNELMNNLSEVKNGTFSRIVYKTDMPIKSAYKKEGISIEKVTETTVRYGINYSHLKNVILKRELNNNSELKSVKPNNFYYLSDKLVKNSVTGKVYLNCFPINNSKSSTINYYIVKSGDSKELYFVLPESIKSYVIDSYWKKSPTDMFRITIDNVLFAGKPTWKKYHALYSLLD